MGWEVLKSMDIYSLSKYGISKPVLAGECSLGLQGYCSFRAKEFPVIGYLGEKLLVGHPTFLPFVRIGESDEYIKKDGFLMTTVERSIVDLIRVNPYNEAISQALCLIDDYTRVRDIAERYALRKELEYQIEEAPSFYNE